MVKVVKWTLPQGKDKKMNREWWCPLVELDYRQKGFGYLMGSIMSGMRWTARVAGN